MTKTAEAQRKSSATPDAPTATPIEQPATKDVGTSARASHDEPVATKPPMLWMMVPFILIGLALYFAR